MNLVVDRESIDNKGPSVLSFKFCAFFDINNPIDSDAESEIGNYIIVIIKYIGVSDI